MRILILGATGRTGRLLVEEAIKHNFEINLMVRDKSKLKLASSFVIVYEGVTTDKEMLLTAMRGCEAVLSALNISRTSDFPWAKLRTPPQFLSESTANMIRTANLLNLKRLIVLTAWGTNETKDNIPFWFRWLIDYSNIGYAYRDHELQEKFLENSSLSWTVVRPVGLTNSVRVKKIQVSFGDSPKPNLFIGRQNVARFMMEALINDSYIQQSPVISEK